MQDLLDVSSALYHLHMIFSSPLLSGAIDQLLGSKLWFVFVLVHTLGSSQAIFIQDRQQTQACLHGLSSINVEICVEDRTCATSMSAMC